MEINIKKTLVKSRQDWEDVALLDPLWGILGEPTKKFGKWNINEFLYSGELEVNYLMSCADRLGFPQKRDSALDFGCGVGRVSVHLAKHFRECYALDISETMISKAMTIKEGQAKSNLFYINEVDLIRFPESTFDLVYCMLVLQHVPQ